jgi:hypothetical protein
MEFSVPSKTIVVSGTFYDGQAVGLPLTDYFLNRAAIDRFTHVHVFRLESGVSGSTFQQIRACPGTASGPNSTISPTIHLRADRFGSGGSDYLWDTNSSTSPTGRDEGFRGSPISENFTMGPESTNGCNLLANGSIVQWWDRSVYISNPLFPTSDWPFVYDFPSTVRYVAPVSSGAAVFTIDSVFLLTGSTPAAYSKHEIKSRELCLSRNGVVPVDGGVLYPSQNGLIVLDSAGQWRNLIQGAYTAKDWAAKNPQNFSATLFKGRYIAVDEATGGYKAVSIELSSGSVSDWGATNFDSLSDLSVNSPVQVATYVGEDIAGSELRLLVFRGSAATENYVYRLQPGASYSAEDAADDHFSWSSHKTKVPKASWLGYARVTADWERLAGEALTIEIFGYYKDANGSMSEWNNSSAPLEFRDNEIVRIPEDQDLGRVRFEWLQIRIMGKVPFHMAEFAETFEELAESYG